MNKEIEEKNATGPAAQPMSVSDEDWDTAIMFGQYSQGDDREDQVTFRRIDLAAYLAQMRVEHEGEMQVLRSLLRDAKFPLMIAALDAMSAGEDDDVQMLRELLRRINAALEVDCEGK